MIHPLSFLNYNIHIAYAGRVQWIPWNPRQAEMNTLSEKAK